MPLSSEVQLRQNGLVPSARTTTGAAIPLDVAITNAAGDQLSGFDPSRPATSTLTQPTVTSASSVIVAANAARRAVAIYNDSGKKAYVAFAATATTVAFTFTIAPGGFYESANDAYTGAIAAIVASGSIVLQVTELS